ncbi:hypothetical protein [Microbacterium sp. LMI1-1-1.1]|uniref:hypothetical protein n=1 Tax=Microbacterium sp. LMI1-1-1.1 TaxID=3135223 RepID=UPI0034677A4E
MKFSQGVAARIAVAAAGGLVLAGTAGAAFAAEVGSDDVTVSVDIEAVEGDGALTLTVAGDSTSLTENAEAGEPTLRQFDGELPTVTVTDTRDAAAINPDAYWYVVGVASDFVGPGQALIGADRLGWTPRLIDEGDTGLVNEGQPVATSQDDGTDPAAPGNNVGLVDQELLYGLAPSAEIRGSGESSWTADASLTLKADRDVAPGEYSSILTLSLFEDIE